MSKRSQQVHVKEVQSNTATVTSVVPQGSGLGLLFFLVYIDDMPVWIKSITRLSADDSFFYSPQQACRSYRSLTRCKSGNKAGVQTQ